MLNEHLATPQRKSAIRIVPLAEELIPAVARLQQQVFAGYLNSRLGLPYQRAFIRYFYAAPAAVALVALDEAGAVAGYVVGAPLGYAARLNRHIFRPGLLGILLRPWLLLDARFRSGTITRARALLGRPPRRNPNPTPVLPRPIYSLVAIGVRPELRGQSIGRQLVAAFEAQAMQHGARSLRLSVYPDNVAARRLYTAAGWQLHPLVPDQTVHYYWKLCAEDVLHYDG